MRKNKKMKVWTKGISEMEYKYPEKTIEERMDILLLTLNNEERTVLSEKLNGKGNA